MPQEIKTNIDLMNSLLNAGANKSMTTATRKIHQFGLYMCRKTIKKSKLKGVPEGSESALLMIFLQVIIAKLQMDQQQVKEAHEKIFGHQAEDSLSPEAAKEEFLKTFH